MLSWKQLFISLFLVLTLLSEGVVTLAIKDIIEDDYVEDIEARSDDTVFDQIAKHNKAVASGTKTWLFEGDIEIVDEPEELKGKTPESRIHSVDASKRSLRRNLEYLWIDRVVPYEFTSDVEPNKDVIEAALGDIQKQSCITFVKRTNQKNWIRFVNRGSCFSSIGRNFWREGYQIISLSSHCQRSKGTIQHEVLHALGFWHEQSRSDRNKYVEIMWENIAEGEQHNFNKYSRSETDDMNSVYDYSSIMHYGRTSFSKNGKPTIQAVGDKNKALGQRDGLSAEDVTQLNALYRCQDLGEVYTSWSDWGPCNDGCQKTRSRFCSNYDKVKCPEASMWGVHNENTKCAHDECNRPINGQWGRWTTWSECSSQCDQGKRTRTRKCDDPEPRHGGSGCHGNSLQSTPCFIKPCGLGADDCQFDGQAMCFWKDASSYPDQYMWRRTSGKTPTGSTGPDGDHSTSQQTQNDGHYMYTEASAPAKTGNKASFLSKTFSSINNRCLTFFYNMNGLGVGALRVFTVTEGSGKENQLWEKTGDQGKGWQEAEVDFSSQHAYKIRFEAERGASFQGDIGLDDVYFVNRKCSEKNQVHTNVPSLFTFPTSTTTTTTTSTTTTRNPLKSYCGVAIKPHGCYSDVSSDPALGKMLVSHRNRIDWKNYDVTLKALLCACINKAKDAGYKYIGLQYYGECWGGSKPSYNRYGNSDQCIDSKFETSYDANNKDICIGKGGANYVYELL